MTHAIMDISKLINILSQPGKHVTELIAEIGFSGDNTLQVNLLRWLVMAFNPELAVIYDILNYNPDNTKLQEQRNAEFADIIRKRDIVCWITGRYAKRCEVAHIYEYKDCKDNGDRYNINNGILLDAGLHKLWDINEIILEPLTESSAQFKINPYSIALERDIPELVIPIEINDITPEMMKFIKKRNYSR